MVTIAAERKCHIFQACKINKIKELMMASVVPESQSAAFAYSYLPTEMDLANITFIIVAFESYF